MSQLPRHNSKPLAAILVAQRYVLILSSLTLASTFFAVVIMRYVFEADLFAYEEWVLTIAFWLYFLGGAQGSWEGSHIKADFLSSFLPQVRARRFFAYLVMVLEIGVLLVLTYWAFYMIYEAILDYPRLAATVAWRIPFAVPHLGIAIGFALMCLFTILRFYMAWNDPDFQKSNLLENE